MKQQADAVGGMVKDADEARRIAKATTRAVTEQSEVLATLASGAARQSQTVGTLAHATNEQATTTTQVAQAMRDVRVAVREINGALASQVKSATASAADVSLVARELASLRRAIASDEPESAPEPSA